MASLRRKPSPEVVTASADVTGATDPVVAIDTDPAPAPLPDGRSAAAAGPQPSSPQLGSFADEASHSALKAQLHALRHSEMTAAAEQRRQQWLSQNELARQNYEALPEIHKGAIDSGHIDTSPGYFDFMNEQLARLQSQRQAAAAARMAEMETRVAEDREPEPKPASRGPIYSAPVSREGSGSGGSYGGSPSRVRLTAQQSELAKLAGITEAEYAKQLIKLDEYKKRGEYSERR